MPDEFEFTLHSPLTKEDWNKLSDAEHENTMFVTFQTPQGRQVRYVKCEVLDKIRAEIKAISIVGRVDEHTSFIRTGEHVKQMALDIIDKYTEEEIWEGIHAQVTAPKGTFDKIWNEAEDNDEI